MKKRLTNIFARKVVNYGAVVEHHNRSALKVFVEDQWNVTSRETSPFCNRSKRQVTFFPENCGRMTVKTYKPWPGCVPPYSDLSHFTGKHSKPWAQGPPAHIWKEPQTMQGSTNQNESGDTGADREDLSPRTASELWWMTLRDLQREDGINITEMGLNLKVQKTTGKRKKVP